MSGKKPPVAPGVPVLGSIPDVMKDLLGTIVKGWRNCGDVVYFKVPRPMLLFAHPDGVRQIVDERFGVHDRSALVRERLGDIIGEAGTFSADAETWRRQAGEVRPVFGGAHLERAAQLVTRATGEMLERFERDHPGGGPFDVQPELVHLGLDVGGRMAFGDLWDREGAAIRSATEGALEYLIPQVTGFPTPIDRFLPPAFRYRRNLAKFNAFVERVIAERRRAPADDLVSVLLDMQMADQRVRDEAATALFGVYKSLPISTLWTWKLLSENAEASERVHQEVADELGGRAPAPADLAGLEYTGRVIDESLRLYPPLFLMSRPPSEDQEIEGYEVPSGLLVLVCPYVTHRHPEFWDDPEGFDPDRFAPGRGERHPYAYMPFGGGPRNCAAEQLGLMQLRLVTALVAQRYRVNPVSAHEIKRNPEFLLRPANGLPVTLTPTNG